LSIILDIQGILKMKNLIKETFKGLTKSRKKILNAFSFISGKKYIDEKSIIGFEALLLSSDVGLEVTDEVVNSIKKMSDKNALPLNLVKQKIKSLINIDIDEKENSKIIQVVGVNGVGKTTCCAKIAEYYKNQGLKTIVIGADTYRSAASNQIKFWCDSNSIDCIVSKNAKNPSSLLYESLSSINLDDTDKVIIDTAGRLHTSLNLMQELKKMESVISKFSNNYANWIAIDAITGQNSANQIGVFANYLKLCGIIINKMDGSSKGGVILPAIKKYKIPFKFIGVGENINDLIPFDFDRYLDGLLGLYDEKN
tara:strand:+ start:1538 stop:2470 length:933 start_codon:yes stop_codon:yes gene_type:complete